VCLPQVQVFVLVLILEKSVLDNNTGIKIVGLSTLHYVGRTILNEAGQTVNHDSRLQSCDNFISISRRERRDKGLKKFRMSVNNNERHRSSNRVTIAAVNNLRKKAMGTTTVTETDD